MAWEIKTRGTARYVKKVRIDGKVVSKILGYGEAGHQAESQLKEAKQSLANLIKHNNEFQLQLDRAESLLNEAVSQHMILNGYIKRGGRWQHVKRINRPLTTGQHQLIRQAQRKSTQIWGATNEISRKFRFKSDPKMTNQEKLRSYKDAPLTRDQRTEVKDLLRLNPDLWRYLGDATEWTRNCAISEIPPGSVQHECIKVGLNEMREKLRTDDDTELEIIAIEQILTNYIQAGTTGYRLESLNSDQIQTETGKFWERRHNLAQSRLLRSMNALAHLRKKRVDIDLSKSRFPTAERIAYPTSDAPIEQAPQT